MPSVAELLWACVVLYPVVTAALWVAGGAVFRWLEEPAGAEGEPAQWPGVTVLIPAFNEQAVIATSVGAALGVDYPRLEVLVLDDGSLDDTAGAAARAGGGDPRCRVVRDPVNRGKADRLNQRLRLARHELVLVSDADTHMHPQAPKRLVSRMLRSPQNAAVAGGGLTDPSEAHALHRARSCSIISEQRGRRNENSRGRVRQSNELHHEGAATAAGAGPPRNGLPSIARCSLSRRRGS
jgi:cellulose synthase/poly-beta-1,6-N-acetylglucosamine synthase-like glycosyltransferase